MGTVHIRHWSVSDGWLDQIPAPKVYLAESEYGLHAYPTLTEALLHIIASDTLRLAIVEKGWMRDPETDDDLEVETCLEVWREGDQLKSQVSINGIVDTGEDCRLEVKEGTWTYDFGGEQLKESRVLRPQVINYELPTFE